MRTGIAILAGAALLAACGETDEAPEAAAQARPSAAAGAEAAPVAGEERRILAFGDSLFAGYGLNPQESYPDRLEAALRARGINARVTNAGVSGDTTAAGRQRIEFVVDSLGERPDLAIVELGGNDLLRGIPPAETRRNLAAILDELKEREIPVLLMGMQAPPNLGPAFMAEFSAIYPALAQEYDADLVPFFLESVWDQPQLIQPDRVHPTAAGINAMVAATLDEVVEALPEPAAD
jgi:acyl-CoA thioesterase-1